MIGLGHSLSLALAPKPVLTPPFTGPLDAYTEGLAGAWSVARRLLGVYIGPLIRVRRSDDDDEMDIGYDVAGLLDVIALLDFVGSGSGYLVRIYDQNTAHGYDQLQATTTLQPKIVNAGTLVLGAGGNAMAGFHETAWMDSGCPAIVTNATVLAVVSELNNAARYAGHSRLLENCLFYFDGPNKYTAEGRYVGVSDGVAGNSTARVGWKQAGATDRRWQLDAGVEIADNVGTLANICGVTGMFVINTDGVNSFGRGNGKIAELITFTSTLSEADVQTIQTGQEGLN